MLSRLIAITCAAVMMLACDDTDTSITRFGQPDPLPETCDESADCYFSSCTESVCVDGECAHAAREDGLLCFGVIPPGYPPDGGHYGGVCAAGQCEPVPENEPAEMVETRLPANGFGDVVILCDVNGPDRCGALGDLCESYGAPCQVGGADGVCVACCAGAEGQLHCAER